MKPLIGMPFDQWRMTHGKVMELYGSIGDHTAGVFQIPLAGGAFLGIIASCGDGWDHVSVSTPIRNPTWDEMQMVKRVFFEPTEWAVEYHPPPSENISHHPYCLHLWRPTAQMLPVPPVYMIA